MHSMTRALLCVASVLFAVLLVRPVSAGGSDDITVVSSWTASPHHSSKSLATWFINAQIAIQNGYTEYGGSPDSFPSGYAALLCGLPRDVIQTVGMIDGVDSKSWQGIAFQSSPFEDERGNQLRRIWYIVIPGGFQLSGVSFTITSDDADQIFTIDVTFGSDAWYASSILARNWGPDGLPDTDDDFYVFDGDQIVHDVVIITEGMAIEAHDYPGPSLQNMIDNATTMYIGAEAPINLDATVTVTGFKGETILTHTEHFHILNQISEGDVDDDGYVDVDDLVAVILAWGQCPAPPASCPADLAPAPAGNGAVDVDDLVAVILCWG